MPSPRKSRAKRDPKTAATIRRPSAFEKAIEDLRQPAQPFANVSPRWLLTAGAIVVVMACAAAWLTLCLLYWQGSWQLLYHPSAVITRTPTSLGIPYEPIRFASSETGTPQLTGWWIPVAAGSRTVLYMHSADGNLSDTVEVLATLHRKNLNVFAFDYRGYGQSRLEHPSEKQLRQDAEWALTYLTLTRHIPSKAIVIFGSGLGANLAMELAADHSELAGVILDQPIQDPMSAVFHDPRGSLLPAHWLVQDRYNLQSPVSRLSIPSLWLFSPTASAQQAYQSVHSQKAAAWLKSPIQADLDFAETLARWLDDLR